MNSKARKLTIASAVLAFVLGVSAAPNAAAAGNPAGPIAAQQGQTQNNKQADNQKAPPRDSSNYEAWLTNQVHHQLAMLPWLTVFDNLEFQVNGSTVTLSGQVVNQVIKPDAEGAVKHIEGVTNVVNNIEVLPVSPMDGQIRAATFRAIYGEPALQIYGPNPESAIHIIVKNGNVTLVGVVNNETDKNLAGIRANGVPNVFAVTNNLQVKKG